MRSLLDQLRNEPSRTGSLLITVYGDAIVPRGGEAGVSLLVRLFETLGVGEGVVRTAVSRLAADGWLVRRRAGRNSFYRLTPWGEAEVRAAALRIYGPLERAWDGRLHLLLPAPGADRAPAEAAGFALLAPGVLVGADPPPPDAGLTLGAAGDAATLREIAQKVWPVQKIGDAYTNFLARFTPLHAAPDTLDPMDAVLVRLVLIHEYRRVVLRDPHLPRAMLPHVWPGREARKLCAAIYAGVLPASEKWLDGAGSLPPADPALFQRFSGGDTPPSAPASSPTR